MRMPRGRGRVVRVMTCAAVLFLCASGCGAGTVHERVDDALSWLDSSKLDDRTRSSLRSYRAYHLELPFDVTLRRPLSARERAALSESGVMIEGESVVVRALAKPVDVEGLLAHDAVASVACSRYVPEGDAGDAWQQRVNSLAVSAWSDDPCWIHGSIEVDGALDDARYEAMAAIMVWPTRSSQRVVSVVLARDSLPTMAGLPFIERFYVEPPARPDR